MQAYQRDEEGDADWTELELPAPPPARGSYYLAEGVEQLAAAVFIRAAQDYSAAVRKGHHGDESRPKDRQDVIYELAVRGGPCHWLWGDLCEVNGRELARLLIENPSRGAVSPERAKRNEPRRLGAYEGKPDGRGRRGAYRLKERAG